MKVIFALFFTFISAQSFAASRIAGKVIFSGLGHDPDLRTGQVIPNVVDIKVEITRFKLKTVNGEVKFSDDVICKKTFKGDRLVNFEGFFDFKEVTCDTMIKGKSVTIHAAAGVFNDAGLKDPFTGALTNTTDFGHWLYATDAAGAKVLSNDAQGSARVYTPVRKMSKSALLTIKHTDPEILDDTIYVTYDLKY